MKTQDPKKTTTFLSKGIILFYEGKIPSVNKWLNAGMRTTYKGGSKRKYPTIYTSKNYAKAKDDMILSFRCQARGTTLKDLVDIVYYYKAPRNTDSDNFQKCVQDAIEGSGIIKNDKQIRNIVLFRYYGKTSSLLIDIHPITGDNPTWPTGDVYPSNNQ